MKETENLMFVKFWYDALRSARDNEKRALKKLEKYEELLTAEEEREYNKYIVKRMKDNNEL